MAQMFNIVANVQFQANNLSTAVASMKRQFATLGKGTFISPTAARGVSELTTNLQKLQVRLDAVAVSAKNVNAAFGGIKNSAKSAAAMNQLAASTAKQAAAVARTQKSTQAATREVDQFGRAVAIASKRFVAFQLAAPAIYGVQRAFTEAAKQAVLFDREMVRLAQVGGDSSRTIGGIASEIGKLSKNLGVSSQGLSQIATTLRQAGLGAEDVRVSLAALAKTELTPTFKNINNTVEGSIALMRQFGIGARDLEGALGSVNTIAAQFAVESEDLVEVIRKAGGAFKAASGDFTAPKESLNQLLALFTSVRDTTRESADAIGTGFRTILARLQSNDVSKSLRELGINLHYTADEAALLGRNVEGQFVGAFSAIKRLSEATKGLQSTDPRFAAIAEQIGGIRQISRVLPLLQQFETTQKALTVAQVGSNSLTRDAAKANDAFLVKLTKVKEEFIDMIRVIGNNRQFQGFLDFTLKLASGLTAIGRAITPLVPALAALGTIKLATSIGRGFQSIAAKPARGYAMGGHVGNETGIIPGSGSGDIVPARLTPGQFVVKKSSAKRFGYGRLASLARRGYAEGGHVDAMVEPKEFIFSKEDAQRVGYHKLRQINNTGQLKGKDSYHGLSEARRRAKHPERYAHGGTIDFRRDKYRAMSEYESLSKQFNHTLDPFETESLYRYTGHQYSGINNHLRGVHSTHPASDETLETINQIRGALSKGQTQRSMAVYRGYGPAGVSGIFDFDPYDKKNIGRIFHDRGFHSTSIDPDVTKRFGSSDSARIILPRGSRAGALGNIAADRSEKEILLPESASLQYAGRRDGFPTFIHRRGYASGGIVETSHGRVKTSPYGRSYNLDQFQQQNVGQRVRLRRLEADPVTGEPTARAQFYAAHRKSRFSKRIGFVKGGKAPKGKKKKLDAAAEFLASKGVDPGPDPATLVSLNEEINANTGAGSVAPSSFVSDLKSFSSDFSAGLVDIDQERFSRQDLAANRVRAAQLYRADREARVAAQAARLPAVLRGNTRSLPAKFKSVGNKTFPQLAKLVQAGQFTPEEIGLTAADLTNLSPDTESTAPRRKRGRASAARKPVGVHVPVPPKLAAEKPFVPPPTYVPSTNIDEIIAKATALDPNFNPANPKEAAKRLSKVSTGLDPREVKLLMNNLVGASPAPVPASVKEKKPRAPRGSRKKGVEVSAPATPPPPTPPVAAGTPDGDDGGKRRRRGKKPQTVLTAGAGGPPEDPEKIKADLINEIRSMGHGKQGVYSQDFYGNSHRTSLNRDKPFRVNDRPGLVLEAYKRNPKNLTDLEREVLALRSLGNSPAPVLGVAQNKAASLGLFGAARGNRVPGTAPFNSANTTRRSQEVDSIRSLGGYSDLVQRQAAYRQKLAAQKQAQAQAARDASVAASQTKFDEINAIRGLGRTPLPVSGRLQAELQRRQEAEARRELESQRAAALASSQTKFEEVDALRGLNNRRNKIPVLGRTYGQYRARQARDATRAAAAERAHQERMNAIDLAVNVHDVRGGVTRGPSRVFSTTAELRNQLQARRRDAGQFGSSDASLQDLFYDARNDANAQLLFQSGVDHTGKKLTKDEIEAGRARFTHLDPNSELFKARRARTRGLRRGESQTLNVTRRGFHGDLATFFQNRGGRNADGDFNVPIQDAIAQADAALSRNDRVEFTRAGSIKSVYSNQNIFQRLPGLPGALLNGARGVDIGQGLRGRFAGTKFGQSRTGRRLSIGARRLGRRIGGSKIAQGLRSGNARFAALGLAAAAPSLLLPDDNPNEAPNAGVASARGAVGGATTGGAIGLQFGPIAGAVGAVVGGILGYTRALKDAHNQIAEFHFDKSFKEFEYGLNSLASGLRKIDQAGLTSINGGIASAQTEASRRVKAQGVGNFFDQHFGSGGNVVSNTLEKHGFGLVNTLASGLATGAKLPFDGIGKLTGLGTINDHVFNSQEELLKQEGNLRQSKLSEILGPQLPAFQQIGDRIAQGIKLSQSDFSASPDKRRASILSQFDQAGGGKIAETISAVGDLPLNEVRENFLKVAVESNSLRLQQEGLKTSTNLLAVQFQKFSRLEQAVDSVISSMSDMNKSLETTSGLFDGGIFAASGPNVSSTLGVSTSSQFNKNIDFLHANLGSGGGNLAGGFTTALRDVDSILRNGSNGVSAAIAKGGLSPDLIGNQLKEFFSSSAPNANALGLTKDSQKKIGAAIDAIDPKDLIEQAKHNPQKLIEDLVDKAFGELPNQMKSLTQKIVDSGNEFAQGLARAAELSSQAGEARSRVSGLRLGSLRASAQSQAFSTGRFSQAGGFLSLDQLRQPFRDRQRQLAGAAAGNPEEIFNRFKSVQASIQKSDQRLSGAGLTPEERAGELSNRTNLVRQASDLQKALEHLADTSEETASIQEKLNEAERQRQAGLSLTERLLTGGAQGARQFRRGGVLSDVAVNQGDFRGFNAKNIQAVLDYLRSVGDLKLPGYGNRTGNDVAEVLLQRSGRFIGGDGVGGLSGPLTNRKVTGQIDQLLAEQANVAKRGEDAGGRLADVKDSLAEKFLTQLKSTNDQFLAKMDALLNAANLKDKDEALNRANIAKGEAFGKRGVATELNRQFSLGGGDGVEQLRRLADSPDFTAFRNARAARLGITQKSGLAQQSIANAFATGEKNFQNGHSSASLFGSSIPLVKALSGDRETDDKFFEAHKNALFAAAPGIAANTGLSTSDINNVALPRYLARQQAFRANPTDTGQFPTGRFDNARELNDAISQTVLHAKLGLSATESTSRSNVARSAFGSDTDAAREKINLAADNFLEISKKLGDLESIKSFAEAAKAYEQAATAATRAQSERDAAVVHKAMGGSIFKPRGSDTVPAMLTPGEYVVNARSARANMGLLHSINSSNGAIYRARGGTALDPAEHKRLLGEIEAENLQKVDSIFASNATNAGELKELIQRGKDTVVNTRLHPNEQGRRRMLALQRLEKEVSGFDNGDKLSSSAGVLYNKLLSADSNAPESTRLSTTYNPLTHIDRAVDRTLKAVGVDAATAGGVHSGVLGVALPAESDFPEILERQEQVRRRRLSDAEKQALNINETSLGLGLDPKFETEKRVAAAAAEHAARFAPVHASVAKLRKTVDQAKADSAAFASSPDAAKAASAKGQVDAILKERDERIRRMKLNTDQLQYENIRRYEGISSLRNKPFSVDGSNAVLGAVSAVGSGTGAGAAAPGVSHTFTGVYSPRSVASTKGFSRRQRSFLQYFKNATKFYEGRVGPVSPKELAKARRAYGQLLSLGNADNDDIKSAREAFLSSNIGKEALSGPEVVKPTSLADTAQNRIDRGRERRHRAADARLEVLKRRREVIRKRRHLPPAAGQDKVSAMVTPGEYIVNANAARQNRGLLDDINGSGQNPIYRATGGPVGSGSSGGGTGSSVVGSLGKLDETVGRFGGVVNQFGNAVAAMAKSISSMPTQVTLKLEPTKHEVIFNGAEMLKTLVPAMQEYVNQKIVESFAKYEKSQQTRVN